MFNKKFCPKAAAAASALTETTRGFYLEKRERSSCLWIIQAVSDTQGEMLPAADADAGRPLCAPSSDQNTPFTHINSISLDKIIPAPVWIPLVPRVKKRKERKKIQVLELSALALSSFTRSPIVVRENYIIIRSKIWYIIKTNKCVQFYCLKIDWVPIILDSN